MVEREQFPELMSVAEVAAAFRLSDQTIHRWVRDGRLEYVDVLGVKRFRRDYIQALVRGDRPLPTGADA